jgi:hypothetical protein
MSRDISAERVVAFRLARHRLTAGNPAPAAANALGRFLGRPGAPRLRIGRVTG